MRESLKTDNLSTARYTNYFYLSSIITIILHSILSRGWQFLAASGLENAAWGMTVDFVNDQVEEN
jgi:hypothetical protein